MLHSAQRQVTEGVSEVAPSHGVIHFGAFRVDLRTGELCKHGFRVRLQDQPFHILQILLEHPGELITRQELQEQIWPAGTFVDSEKGLNNAIMKLRDALGDSSERPNFVETIPRRGYRFIGNVQNGGTTAAAREVIASSTVSEVGTGAPHRQAFRWGLSLGVSVVAALVLVLWLNIGGMRDRLFGGSATPRVESLAKITQISQWNKPMDGTRLSPDGHAVAFTSPMGGIAQVFLMLTSGGDPLQLTNDPGEKYVNTFSPDGKEVYYGRWLGHDEVWAVTTLGGVPRRVVSGREAVASAVGGSIYYGKSDSPGVYRVEKFGENEELVYKPEGTDQFFAPLLLFPGGNGLLVAGYRDGSPNFRFYKINVTSHEGVDFGEVSGSPDDIVWGEPGKTVLLSRTINGLTNIWSYSLKDRSLTQITSGAGPDFSPMPDPGGKGIYYVHGKSSGFLTAYNVHSKVSTDILSEEATQPQISPDGKRVMYITLPAPKRNELWVSDIDGGNKVKLAIGEQLTTGTWAPDSFHLSFNEERVGAGAKVYIVGADGSGLREIAGPGENIHSSVLSPDQKSVYVSATGKTPDSTENVWKLSVDGSNPEKLVDNCGMGFVSDADPSGQYLLFDVPYGEKIGIYEVSISDRKCVSLLPGIVTFTATFAHDGKSFWYAVASRGEVAIYRQAWKDGKTIGAPQVTLKVPFVFPLRYKDNAYDFSWDLSTIVYARPGGHADLYLLSQK